MANDTRTFFDNYSKRRLQFKATDVDILIGYFKKRGFGEVAAVNTATVILTQASMEGLDIMKLLDLLKGVNEVQLNRIIASLLNVDRRKTSQIGIREEYSGDQFMKRNIIR